MNKLKGGTFIQCLVQTKYFTKNKYYQVLDSDLSLGKVWVMDDSRFTEELKKNQWKPLSDEEAHIVYSTNLHGITAQGTWPALFKSGDTVVINETFSVTNKIIAEKGKTYLVECSGMPRYNNCFITINGIKVYLNYHIDNGDILNTKAFTLIDAAHKSSKPKIHVSGWGNW